MIDSYRRQVSQYQNNIAKLRSQKASELSKAVESGNKSRAARQAANKANSPSMNKIKNNDADRHAKDQAKHENEVAKIEAKIAAEDAKLIRVTAQLDNEIKKLDKKKADEQKRQADAQQRQFRSMESSLSRQDSQHRMLTERVNNLSALPENILVAFFATDPTTVSERRLLLDEEVRDIQENIRLSHHRDVVKLESRWALRPKDILQYMNELEPTIVHFSGHGTADDELVLQDGNGSAKYVSLESIVSAFEHFDTVRLVFLNTCHSYAQAAELTRYVDAAIGMNKSIGDEAARIFAAQFYSAIGFGKSIPSAFAQAKTALMIEGISEESTPELHIKEGVEEIDLVLIKPRK